MKKNILSIGILLVSLFMFINIDEVKADQVKHCIYTEKELAKSVITNIVNNKDNKFEYVEKIIDVEPVPNGIFVTKKYVTKEYKFTFGKKNKKGTETVKSTVSSTAFITYENSKDKRVYSGSDMFAKGMYASDFYAAGNIADSSKFLCPFVYIDNDAVSSFNALKKFIIVCPICELITPVKKTENNSAYYSMTYINAVGSKGLKQITPSTTTAEQSDLAKNAVAQSAEKEKSSGCNIFGKEGSKTRSIIKWFVNLIRYAIPILVIVLSVADYVGVVFSGEEDKMKNAHRRLASRIVAAIVFVLIPFLLKFLVDVTELALDTGINSSDMFCGFL